MARPDRPPGFASADPEAAKRAIAHCFGCGPANPHGLHIEAKREGPLAVVEFQGSRAWAGWEDFYHGGVLAAIVDEVAAFAMFQQRPDFGMTRRMTVEYKRRVRWTQPLRAEAEVRERDAEKVRVACRILQEGQVCTEGEVEFRLMAAPPRSDR